MIYHIAYRYTLAMKAFRIIIEHHFHAIGLRQGVSPRVVQAASEAVITFAQRQRMKGMQFDVERFMCQAPKDYFENRLREIERAHRTDLAALLRQ